jgi:hypothetical protein
MKTSLDTIEPVLDGLKHAGLIVENVEDAHAEVRPIYLCRAPAAITVEQILEPIAALENLEIGDARIRSVLQVAHRAMRDATRPITLADMMKGGKIETT